MKKLFILCSIAIVLTVNNSMFVSAKSSDFDIQNNEKYLLSKSLKDVDKFNKKLIKDYREETLITPRYIPDEPPPGEGTLHTDSDIGRSSFWNADIILGHESVDGKKDTNIYGYYNHAAIYDEENDCFISAVPWEGVRTESWTYWKTNYKHVSSLYVSLSDADWSERDAMILYLRLQEGKWYDFSGKFFRMTWYCSKLPWAAYYDFAGIDLDPDGPLSLYVVPDDLYDTQWTALFADSNKS